MSACLPIIMCLNAVVISMFSYGSMGRGAFTAHQLFILPLKLVNKLVPEETQGKRSANPYVMLALSCSNEL